MQRILAVLIVLLLGGGVVAAVVKSGDEKAPIAEPTATPTPSETLTFDGAAPTESSFTETPTDTPSETGTEEPTTSPTELARTGSGSFVPAALLTLLLAAGAVVVIGRTRAAR